MSKCEAPIGKACYILGVDDALIWEIPNSTIDPLGYNFKLGEYTTTVIDGIEQVGENVVVAVPILASQFTEEGVFSGYIVSNTKSAGSYEALNIIVTFDKAIDAI